MPDLTTEPHTKIARVLDESGALLLAIRELKIAEEKKEDSQTIAAYKKALRERRRKAAITKNDLTIALKNQVEARRHPRFLYQIGICHEILDERDKALLAYTRSITKRPLPLAYVQRALFFLGTRQMRSALQDLESALKIEPDYPRALFFRGLYYAKKSASAQSQKSKKADRSDTQTSPSNAQNPGEELARSIRLLKDRRPHYAAILRYYQSHPQEARALFEQKSPALGEFL